MLAATVCKAKVNSSFDLVRVSTGSKTPDEDDDDQSYTDLYNELIHPHGILLLILEGFYVNFLKWDWQELNTKLHSRFGFGDDFNCDVEEVPNAIDHLKKWIEKNPVEGVLAQTWLEKIKALTLAVNAGDLYA